MRFMILLRAIGEAEAETAERAALLAEMGRFNHQLARGGVLLAAAGLHPPHEGVGIQRMDVARGSGRPAPVVAAGPREFLSGFWLLEVRSEEEAVEWVKRLPRLEGSEIVIELRRAMDPADPDGLESERSRA